MANRKQHSEPVDELRRHRRQRQQTARPKKRRRVWLKVTALAVFLIVVAGLGASAGGIYAMTRDLPSLDSLERRPNALNTTIYAKNGAVIAELHGAENRVQLKSEQIPEIMKQATVAVEDERFYGHHGVDAQGIARAMMKNLRAGEIIEGGSTITQQLVKNIYRRNERTYSRKMREALLAAALEGYDAGRRTVAMLTTDAAPATVTASDCRGGTYEMSLQAGTEPVLETREGGDAPESLPQTM